MSSETRAVEHSLAARDIHDEWEARYRTPQLMVFQDEQVDFLARLIGANRANQRPGCGLWERHQRGALGAAGSPRARDRLL